MAARRDEREEVADRAGELFGCSAAAAAATAAVGELRGMFVAALPPLRRGVGRVAAAAAGVGLSLIIAVVAVGLVVVAEMSKAWVDWMGSSSEGAMRSRSISDDSIF